MGKKHKQHRNWERPQFREIPSQPANENEIPNQEVYTMAQPRTIKQLMELGPGEPVSPAEQAMLTAYFANKGKKGNTNFLIVGAKALQGKLADMGDDIKDAYERQLIREEIDEAIEEKVDELRRQMTAQVPARNRR